MTLSKVKPLKIETLTDGNTDDNGFPNELNPNIDCVTASGYSFQGSDVMYIDCGGPSGAMRFLDGDIKTITTLRQLISSINYYNVSATAPTSNQILVWNSSTNQWEPKDGTYITTSPPGISISSNTNTSTSITTYALLNSMTITPSVVGNWEVIFTAQMSSTADCFISVFVGGTQVTTSERTGTGPAGLHNFIMATSEKVTVTAGQVIEIRWKATGSAVTCTGRNMSIVKVT